jgi:hypothetical protein
VTGTGYLVVAFENNSTSVPYSFIFISPTLCKTATHTHTHTTEVSNQRNWTGRGVVHACGIRNAYRI